MAKRKRLKKPETASTKSGALRDFFSDPFVHVIAIIVLGFLIYLSTSEAPFVFDDVGNIPNNPAVRAMRYFTDGAFLDKAIAKGTVDEHFRSRIVGHLTFALNYRLHGPRVLGYHVFNVLTHVTNSILVYLLVLLTTRTPWFRRAAGDKKDPYAYRMASLFAALLFVSHPVQTGAVTYISQRFASLATLFCLLSMVMYVWGRLAGAGNSAGGQAGPRHGGWRSRVPYGVSILSAVLAMKTKEISFALPVVISLYEVMFFEEKAWRRLLSLLPLLLTMLIIPVTVLGEKTAVTEIRRIGESVQGGGSGNTALSYLLTQFRVIVTYLRLLVLPVNQNLDYDYPVYHSFFTPAVFLSFIFLAVIFISAVYLYRKSGREESADRQWLRVIAFGIFWFFITLSVESSIIPLVDVIFEHRLYLPSAGLFMAVVSAAAIAERRFGSAGAKTVPVFLSLAVLLLGVAAFQRNQVWRDTIRLWEDVVSKSPNKARPYVNLGNAFLDLGQYQQAEHEFSRALALDPADDKVRNNLAMLRLYMGKSDSARRDLELLIKRRPEDPMAYDNLGTFYARMGRPDDAVEEYKKALALDPSYLNAHFNLGATYFNKRDFDAAMTEFGIVDSIDPTRKKAHFYRGAIYFQRGLYEKAITEFRKELTADPGSADTYFQLGNAFSMLGRTSEAMAAYGTATALNPGLREARTPSEALGKTLGTGE
ncbi:MAG: tetratricopeptide repeat protein [Nitrospiraceae bacterium]|nr:tetratricopeptide repeat protein [Nitrospiraceae bacterium]